MNPERRRSQGDDASDVPAAGAIDPAVRERLFPAKSDSQVSAPVPDPSGLRFDHFTVEDRIGVGGMGSVFRAVDERLDRTVAIKILSPDQSVDPAVVQRFRNEARAAARLDHENVVRVFYVGEDHGLHFIAYEFVEGTNVRDLIRRSGRLEVGQAVDFTLQLALALVHTSEADVVHRDIKPSNVIVTPKGRAKLVDLGLARQPVEGSLDELTIAGTTLGTFDYISPEQAKDPRGVDVRSDIYSLGCTLYHMLTGEPPYSDGTVLQKLLDHQGKEPPDPSKKNRLVPPILAQLCRRMMASEPSKRPRTAERLVRDLGEVAAQLGVAPRTGASIVWPAPAEPTFWEKHLGWMTTVAALFVIVFVVESLPVSNPTPRLDADTDAGPAPSRPPLDERVAAVTKPDGSDNDVVDGGTVPNEPRSSETIEPVFPLSGSPSPWFPGLDWDPEGPPLQSPLSPERTVEPETVTGTPTDPATTTPTETNVPRTSPDPAELGPAISIVPDDGSPPKSYETLEAAVAEAKDGDIVELAFDGPRRQKPVNVGNKRITIRAARGSEPVVEFVHHRIPAEGDLIAMINVTNGSVDIVNVEIVLQVDPSVALLDEARWSIVRTTGTGSVRIRNTHITVRNPAARSVAIVDSTSSGSAGIDMKMMKEGSAGERPRAEIVVANTVVRGDTDLVHIGHARPLRLDVSNSVATLDQSLLVITGDDDDLGRSTSVEVAIEHVTGIVGNGLLRFDAGQAPRFLPAVQVTSRNNLFATRTSVGLVTMSGNDEAQDFRTRLTWNGEQSFYDGFEVFWTIAGTGPGGEFREVDFEAWKRLWEPRGVQTSVAWANDWPANELVDLLPSDLALDPETEANPAIGGATDGTDVGADLLRVGPDARR